MSQVLNFGVPSPIDVQVEGPNLDQSYQIARQLKDEIATVPGAVDVHVKQAIRYPALHINVDREKAAQLGLTEQSVANSMLISLSSSALIAPSYFLNPTNNVNYIVAVRIPPEHFDSVAGADEHSAEPAGIGRLRCRPRAQPQTQPVPQPQYETLANVSQIIPDSVPAEVNHYTVQRVIDINANLQGRDLGSVVAGIQKKIDGLGKLPLGMRITHSRPVRSDEFVVPQFADGIDSGHRAGVSADRGAVSVVDGSFHHHDRGAGSAGGDSVDAGLDRLDHQRRIADGLDHGGGHRDFELDPAGELRQ